MMMHSESGDLLPKTTPLPGTLRAEWKRCGKPNCRCTSGALHGPYWYRRWREDGRQRRAYVRAGDLERVRDALAEWRRLHPPTWAERVILTELRRLTQQMEAC